MDASRNEERAEQKSLEATGQAKGTSREADTKPTDADRKRKATKAKRTRYMPV